MSSNPSQLLADGSLPATPTQLFARLAELDIQCTTTSHPAVFTVEEAKKYRGKILGLHMKNLFLRNKKGQMWLVVCLEDQRVDLKALGRTIGAGNLSFGSPERLMTYLGLTPGSVSPFGVINDTESRVRMIVDQDILDQGPLNFHPLVNTMTTTIKAGDFMRFLEAMHHPPVALDFTQFIPAA